MIALGRPLGMIGADSEATLSDGTGGLGAGGGLGGEGDGGICSAAGVKSEVVGVQNESCHVIQVARRRSASPKDGQVSERRDFRKGLKSPLQSWQCWSESARGVPVRARRRQ